MIESKTVERLEQSRVRVSVSINKDVAKKKYEGVVQEYSKKAQVKGFRPGKVPIHVLEQKFGEGLRMDAAQKLIEESLKILYEEIDEKPLSFAAPLLESNPDFSPDKPFSYVVSYDIFPSFELKKLSGFAIEEPQVDIDEAAIHSELERIRLQTAISIDKQSGTVEKGNIVTLSYSELDESGNTIATSQRNSSVTIGSGQLPYNLDDDLIGMELDEEKSIEKKLPSPEGDDTDQQKKIIKVKVTNIKEYDLPDIDDEFAQDVDEKYKTLEDLKTDISRQLNEAKEKRIKEIMQNSILGKISEANPIVLPESMIEAELKNTWQRFVRDVGGDEKTLQAMLQADNRSRTDLYAEWRPETEKSLKFQLISQKLIADRKIEASAEDIAEKIQVLAKQNNITEEKVKEHYEANRMMEYLKNEIMEEKLINQLFEESTITKGKQIKYLELK